MSEIPIRPGDAFVNAMSAFPDLDDLEKDFDILYFLDLCAGIEAAVLQNSLVSIGPIGSMTAKRMNPIVRSLLDAEVLVRYELVAEDQVAMSRQLLSHQNARDLLALLPKSIPAGDPSSHLAVMAEGVSLAGDLGFEAECGLPLVLTAHSMPLYVALPQFKAEHAAQHRFRGELAAKYSDFKQILFALKQQVDGEEIIAIPPIALEVLEIANTQDDLGTAVLEVRQKYEQLRKYFTELDEIMQSKAQSPRTKLGEQAKLKKAISKLFSAKEVDGLTVLTTFATELNETIDLKAMADAEGGIDWKKIVGSLIRHAEDIYWRFRLRPLHATKRRYLDLASKRVADNVRHHFGHQLIERDRLSVAKFSAVIDGLRVPSESETER